MIPRLPINTTPIARLTPRSVLQNPVANKASASRVKSALGQFELAKQFHQVESGPKSLINSYEWQDFNAPRDRSLLSQALCLTRKNAVSPELRHAALLWNFKDSTILKKLTHSSLFAFASRKPLIRKKRISTTQFARQARQKLRNGKAFNFKKINNPAEEIKPKLNSVRNSISEEKPLLSLLEFRNKLRSEMEDDYETPEPSDHLVDTFLQQTESQNDFEPILPPAKPHESVTKVTPVDFKFEPLPKGASSGVNLQRRNSDTALLAQNNQMEKLKRHHSIGDRFEYDTSNSDTQVQAEKTPLNAEKTVQNAPEISTHQDQADLSSSLKSNLRKPFTSLYRSLSSPSIPSSSSIKSEKLRRSTYSSFSTFNTKPRISKVSSGRSTHSVESKNSFSNLKTLPNQLKDLGQMIKNSAWYQFIEKRMAIMFNTSS